jgi:error-prone DNA polymerase
VAGLFNAQPMGFYSVATIAEDARRHGVEVLPVDVNRSAWDATVEAPTPRPREGKGMRSRTPPEGNGAVRLGLRFVHGLGEGLRHRAEKLAGRAPFGSLPEFVRASGLPRTVLENLAAGDAFSCFGFPRREALWEVGRITTAGEQGPLFANVPPVAEREEPRLPAVSVQEAMVLDYRITGVGFGPHPVSFVREELRRCGGLTAAELSMSESGRTITSGGLVICRQRPSTAKGTLFVTLEDETGFVNLIVRDQIFRRYRQLLRTAVLLQVRGRLEREGPVVNVLAREFVPLSLPAGGLENRSRDFR